MPDRLLLLGSLPLLLLGLLAAGLGVPIPEDPLLLAAGALSHRTGEPWWLVLPTVYAAVIAADCVLFMLARRFGEALVGRRPFRWLATPERRGRAAALIERHGAAAVFFGRHLPGIRPLVFVLVGIERMALGTFLFWDALAGLVTVPVVFGLGYLFSSHVAAIELGIARIEHWAAAVAGAIALTAWWVWSRRPGEDQR